MKPKSAISNPKTKPTKKTKQEATIKAIQHRLKRLELVASRLEATNQKESIHEHLLPI